jgi:GLPGLI family protein
MKYFSLIFIVLISAPDFVSSQQTLNITYKRVPNIEYQLRNQQNPKIRERVAKRLMEQKEYFDLIVTNEKSLYRNADNKKIKNAQQQLQEDDSRLDAGGSSGAYKSLKDKLYIENVSLLGRSFYIYDTLPDFDWKITKESKQIGGYSCSKATLDYNGIAVVAWFTFEIPVPNGPEEFGGLPGLILEVEKPFQTITVTKVSPLKEKITITIPKKQGKKV